MNDIQELRELLKTATPKYQMRLISMRGEAILQMGDDPLANGRSIQLAEKDVMLIIAAVNTLPGLLDEIEALRKEVARWKKVDVYLRVRGVEVYHDSTQPDGPGDVIIVDAKHILKKEIGK